MPSIFRICGNESQPGLQVLWAGYTPGLQLIVFKPITFRVTRPDALPPTYGAGDSGELYGPVGYSGFQVTQMIEGILGGLRFSISVFFGVEKIFASIVLGSLI